MTILKKVFGIISYFPNNDSDYHIETRRERSRRFRELLFKLEELWPDVDIMVIAQNWQDFELPEIKNKIITFHYGKLGILGARRELRKRFLASPYDYLIMLDDDGMIETEDPSIYMHEIDKHPDGIGVIRHVNCPLMLLAISKTLYSQIDMPDIDAEKGQGFEDDVFVASCFAKFPDKAFDFPEDCIQETSFKYNGVGKCPSTWAGERKYDWKHMVANTKSRIFVLENPVVRTAPIPVDIPTIDLIITYVNNADRNWLQDFIRTTSLHKPTPTRFRSWGTLKYLFRGIESYMPFIRNVILVVARESQVPTWVDKSKVRIVYHRDFIPEQFLPTFNSCTIESYFWRIPDLSDKIIYFNDDIFPIGPMVESNFFTGNTPHIKFVAHEKYAKNNMFKSQCRSGVDLITRVLDLPKYAEGTTLRPYHISTAFTKSCLENVGKLCESLLPSTLTRMRSTKNVNQYIYPYYHYFTNDYVSQIVNYKYFSIEDRNISAITDEIRQENYQLICLNDSDKIRDYATTRSKLLAGFACKFPERSRFELP